MQTPHDPLAPFLIPNTALRAPAMLQLDPSQFNHLLVGDDGAKVDF